MDKSKAKIYAEEVAALIAKADTIPGLSATARRMAEAAEKNFRSVEGIDILSVGVVMSVIGSSDTYACRDAYNAGADLDMLKATAMAGMAYLYVADSIFKSEGVLKSLEDHFADGSKEGS